jgi:uncharacterized membrane protein YeaQ/YmgE (transglycosylase-associated protein family)
MNFILWMVMGATVGLVAFSVLNLNSGRGLAISIGIGVLTAVFGGHILAPVFGGTVGEAGEFSPFALLVAAATALGSLTISDMTSARLRL